MPSMPRRPCRRKGCPNLITTGSYCDQHLKQQRRQYDQTRRNADAKKFYNSKEWKRTRDRIITAEPVCRVCSNALAYAVDHIIPRELGGSDDDDNLQPICKPCHSTKTQKENNAKRQNNNSGGSTMNLQIIGYIKALTNAEVTTTEEDTITTYHVTKNGKTADVKVGASAHAHMSADAIAKHVRDEASKVFSTGEK